MFKVRGMITIPGQNPLFISIPTLTAKFEYLLLSTTSDTDWLWMELSIEKEEEPDSIIRAQREWRRMQFYGLAEFFNEIAYYLAYLDAINTFPEIQSNTVMFHGSNIILRMTACWDRVGRFLYDRFELNFTDNIYFGTVVDEILKDKRYKKTEKKHLLEMKRQFSQDKKIRDWRNNYIHNYGEYFEREIEKNIVTEYFPLDPKSREFLRNKLIDLIHESFPRLKLIMKLTSKLFDENS